MNRWSTANASTSAAERPRRYCTLQKQCASGVTRTLPRCLSAFSTKRSGVAAWLVTCCSNRASPIPEARQWSPHLIGGHYADPVPAPPDLHVFDIAATDHTDSG